MPKSSDPCAVVIEGVPCEATTEVLNFCRFHWRQQNRGATFTTRRTRRPRGRAIERDSEGRKECARCERWHPVQRYGPAANTADRLQSWCKDCSADYGLLTRYGVTRAEVDAMVSQQGGCGICGSIKPRHEGFRNGWHVDHDHKCCPTDKTCGRCVRGVLCADCNKLLGLAHDSVERLTQAISYLEDCEARHESEEDARTVSRQELSEPERLSDTQADHDAA